MYGVIAFAQELKQTDTIMLQSEVNSSLSLAQKNIKNYNYLQAKSGLESALEKAKILNNKKSLGLVYFNLGKIQYLLEESNQAIITLIRAIEIQRFAKDKINIAETHKTLGDVYLNSKKPKQAIEHYISAQTFSNLENLKNLETETIIKKGEAHLVLGDYRSAEIAFKKAVTLSRKFNIDRQLSISLINLGITQTKNGLLLSAQKNIKEGNTIAKENKAVEILNLGYLSLSNLQELQGNYRLANKNLKAHLKLTDSLFETKSGLLLKEKINESIIASQLDAQKQVNAELEEENEEEASTSTFNQLTTILTIALITILSLLTLSLYKNNNIRLKSNLVLQNKNNTLIESKEKAELASRTKANFLSTVTHELRTPLYAVTGLTNMLLEEDPKPDQIPHLNSLKFSGDYLLTFINDILQINKIEAQKVEIEKEVFNLKKKIANIISALNNSASLNNVKLHFEFDEKLPHNYLSDQLKISQILINLIGNSIKFTKDGDIWVRVNKINNINGIYNIRIEIEDNGIGFSKEKQERMFESFSQGSNQINRKYGGTGLGLSIVKGLIEILKGKIYFESELEKGTTFFVEIPFEFAEETVEREQISYFKNINEDILNKVNILLVEDNKINQMITKKILNKLKLNCEVVENGEDAVEKVKSNTYDVVLMDIHMPGISGIEATKIIRKFDKKLSIYALTAVTIEDKMVEFDEAEFTDIISKPFKQEDFEKKLFDAIVLKEKA
ncbi:ATP-binding protein [Lacinutrix sp.]|uniref:ATP-binding protein n=1 Tax=Lacinutrix sp. TaxID=1937692 RepID=UPI0030EC00B4